MMRVIRPKIPPPILAKSPHFDWFRDYLLWIHCNHWFGFHALRIHYLDFPMPFLGRREIDLYCHQSHRDRDPTIQNHPMEICRYCLQSHPCQYLSIPLNQGKCIDCVINSVQISIKFC